MSEILTIVPPDWHEIQGINQMVVDSGYDMAYWMALMANKEWAAFETLYETHLPPNTSTSDAQILGDSVFVKLFSTL